MRAFLKRHPGTPCDAVERIEVEVSRGLELHYFVSGTIADLRIAPLSSPERTDELWKTTCFEAFLRTPPDSDYFEFNFAPSTCWSAYHFTNTRVGMRVAREIAAPRIEIRSSATTFELKAALDPVPDAPWRLALSAVIEETSGRKSYWALAHPPGKPDFHHPDCFALEFPAASGA
jgi:hypothetical protein